MTEDLTASTAGTLTSAAETEVVALIAALVAIVVGFFVARLAQRWTGRSLELLDGWMARYATSDRSFVSPATISVVRGVIYWLVVLLAVIVALRLLGIGGFTEAFDEVVALIPRLLIGIIIVSAGHTLGLLTGGLIVRVADTIEPDSLVPRLVHTVIIVLAVLIAVQQLGIDVTFVSQLLFGVLFIFFGGLALAFALGARTHVANLIARSELARFSIGDRILIDDLEGTIIEIRHTGVDIQHEHGVVSVPAARFAIAAVTRINQEVEDG